jgi:hypothetical protein
MTRPTRGQGRGNRGSGRGRGRQGWGKVEGKRLLPVQSMNKQRGIRQQRSPSLARCENGRQLTYNQEGLRDRKFQWITRFETCYIRGE